MYKANENIVALNLLTVCVRSAQCQIEASADLAEGEKGKDRDWVRRGEKGK